MEDARALTGSLNPNDRKERRRLLTMSLRAERHMRVSIGRELAQMLLDDCGPRGQVTPDNDSLLAHLLVARD